MEDKSNILSSYAPGSLLPDLYLVLLDKYGQIIHNDNSTVVNISISSMGNSEIIPSCSLDQVQIINGFTSL